MSEDSRDCVSTGRLKLIRAGIKKLRKKARIRVDVGVVELVVDKMLQVGLIREREATRSPISFKRA